MTKEDMLDDLEQFIDARFAQQAAELDEKHDEKLSHTLDEKLAPIHQKIDDLTAFVTETFDAATDDTDKRFASQASELLGSNSGLPTIFFSA